MHALPTATIIVLNWNGRSFLEACLDALLDQTHKPDQIILVDNGSTDGSLELVQAHYPAVEIQENGINLGYAKGVNNALRNLSSEVGVLVNPDIVVSRDWLEMLLGAISADKAAGIAGFKLLFPGEEELNQNGVDPRGQKLQYAGGFITHPRAMPHHRSMYVRDEGQFNTPAGVDFVNGAALAVRRDTIETSGLLDEGFFMYFEDADWCARARREGFRVLYVPEATAIHDESATAVRDSPSYLRYFHTGRWRYLLKHFNVSEIIEKTLAAEAAWMGKIEGNERQALGWAYRTTLDAFPEIMKTRLTHGAEAITTADQAAIRAGLLDLRQEAMLWAKNPADWQRLEEAGRIESQPFSSTTPLLGPLFARLRDIWAGVSTKYYISGLNEQQNAFNQAFIEELQAIEERLRAFEDKRMKQEADQRDLSWEIKTVQQELNKTYRLIARIESRLDKSAKGND